MSCAGAGFEQEVLWLFVAAGVTHLVPDGTFSGLRWMPCWPLCFGTLVSDACVGQGWGPVAESRRVLRLAPVS